ncbi:ABC transporter ATP-binding protein [Metallumcola ferriviriculae]|uniref:ABC transporter ATP-binding protein n=1 Tax=Metallumcola ferriviriculae TaxID=3039180 RepID=A0AAU0UN20_9FIRM|nr:ABC transporter ATP-binding protein [Desulfitibacteraceae bacterium MK1]
MLEISAIEAYYGNIRILKGVDLQVPEGSIVTLIGANGAGKTTTLRTITGALVPRSGRITFKGEDIIGWPLHKVARIGISMIPEGRAIFKKLTVEENLEMGALNRKDNEVKQDKERVMDRFPILRERLTQQAGNLSGGEQQMLAIARALMARPKLLLLDEPSMGLAPQIVADVFRVIKEINDQGTTVLLVEQNARQALKVAHYGYVMETGRIVLSGTAAALAQDPKVIEAYLGSRAV